MSTQTQTTTTAATPPPPPAADTKAAETGTSLITAPDAADKKTEGAAAGATEQKQTADTGGDKAKQEAAQKAAEDFELKLPEGVDPIKDKAIVDGFKAGAKEWGLKGEQAQKALDFYAKAQKEAVAKADAEWKAQNEAWKKQVQDDKDLGGPKLKETIAHAKRFVAKFGTPALTKLLDDSGLGNHPDAVRLFAAAGKALAEDTVGGAGAPTNKKAPDDPASLYPNTKF